MFWGVTKQFCIVMISWALSLLSVFNATRISICRLMTTILPIQTRGYNAKRSRVRSRAKSSWLFFHFPPFFFHYSLPFSVKKTRGAIISGGRKKGVSHYRTYTRGNHALVIGYLCRACNREALYSTISQLLHSYPAVTVNCLFHIADWRNLEV